MSQREVMHRAIDALELGIRTSYSEQNNEHFSEAIEMIRAELAKPDPAPDYQHPDIQALIARDARKNIELSIFASLVEDPDYEFGTIDSEYATDLHYRLRDKLKNEHEAKPERVVPEGWQLVPIEPTELRQKLASVLAKKQEDKLNDMSEAEILKRLEEL